MISLDKIFQAKLLKTPLFPCWIEKNCYSKVWFPQLSHNITFNFIYRYFEYIFQKPHVYIHAYQLHWCLYILKILFEFKYKKSWKYINLYKKECLVFILFNIFYNKSFTTFVLFFPFFLSLVLRTNQSLILYSRNSGPK